MRWEYSPGSALFLVWTQQRSEFEPDSQFAFGHGMSQLIKQRPDICSS